MSKRRKPLRFETMEPRRLLAGLAITEVQAANATTLETRVRASDRDPYQGDVLTPDWIEIRNSSNQTADLGGFHLTDSSNKPTKWQIPDGVRLAAGAHLVVYASQLDIYDTKLDETGNLHTNFKLDPDGEYVGLTNPSGETVHHFWMRPGQRADVSWGIGSDQPGFLTQPTPGWNNSTAYQDVVDDVRFSSERGTYSGAFGLHLSTGASNTEIWYTTDGSVPNPENGIRYRNSLPINTTTTVRAAAFKEGYLPSNIVSHTYLFTSHVAQQSGQSMPRTNWGHAGPDWELDRDVYAHGNVDDRFVPTDLTTIPTVSLSMPADQLFGSNGIYVQGESVQVPTSFEYFSSTETGTQALSTVQVVGGGSVRRWNSDKLSLRVRFTEDVGEDNLEHSVFGPASASSFKTLVLDARFNSSWTYGGEFDGANQRARAQYLRDQYTADLQNAVGGYAPESRPVHLYLNGLYWGLYVMHERPDDDFAETYLGGTDEAYDVVKHNPNDVVNGSNENYFSLLRTIRRNQAVLANYESTEQQLDVDDFIRYMLVNFHVGNSDWGRHNWYASFNRESDDGRWRFHSWDAEKSFVSGRQDVTTKNDLNGPTEIHQRLTHSPEYRLRFAEISHELLSEDGVLGDRETARGYLELSQEIDLAIRAESARWGDNRRTQPFTRSDWLRQREELLQDFFPGRAETVKAQLRRAGLYPNENSQPPNVLLNGSPSAGGSVSRGSELALSATNGLIFYTTNGADPRQPGGQLADSAVRFDRSIIVDRPIQLRARARLQDGSWTSMVSADFVPHAERAGTKIRISEINYHPYQPSEAEISAGFDDADDFEFIELLNASNQTIDLRDVSFEQVVVGSRANGIEFDFNQVAAIQLGPRERLVIVENIEAFEFRYGTQIPIAGQWSGKLSNDGEYLRLLSGEVAVHHFAFDDAWYPATDGLGATLQIENENGNDLAFWTHADNWRASYRTGGTPSRLDSSFPGDANHDGVFNSQDLVAIFRVAEYEDNMTLNSTFEDGDFNGDAEFDSSDLILAFTVGSYSNAVRPQFESDSLFARDARLFGEAAFMTSRQDRNVRIQAELGDDLDDASPQLVDLVFVR